VGRDPRCHSEAAWGKLFALWEQNLKQPKT